MLAQFRALAKSRVAIVLFGLLALSFIGWQAKGTFGAGGGGRIAKDAVIQVGARSLGPAAFKRMFDQAVDQVQQQARRPVTAQEALQAGFDRRVAEQAGDSMAMFELIARTGVTPSDRQVVGEIRKATAFFDPISGRFDRKTYEQRLAQAGLTVKEFEQSLRDEVAQAHFAAGMVAGLRAPLISTAVETAYNREGRSFSWFPIPPAAVGGPVQPTDAQLTQFMKEHSAQLTRPPMRLLSVVRFSAAALAPTLPVDAAAVQKRFDFEKDSLSQPEKRTVVQITAKDAAGAAALSAKLKSGGDPAATAKAAGLQLVPYQASPKIGIADKTVADTAFRMKAGEISGPIHGDLGWAVVKVLAVTPGHQATVDEARAKIEAEVKTTAAQDRVYQQAQKYADAKAGGAGLAAAAKAVGATPQPVGPITEQGAGPQGQPAGLPPKLLVAAFKLPQGGESDAVELSPGEYAAVRVEKVLPPTLPPLDELRPQLTRIYVLQNLVDRLKTKGEAAAEQIRHGATVDAAARGVGSAASHAVGTLRDAGGQSFGKELVAQVFAAKPGEVVVARDEKLGVIVAKLEQVSAPATAEAAPQIVAGRLQTSREMLSAVGEAVRLAARDRFKPVIDAKRARSAAGGSDQTAGAAP